MTNDKNKQKSNHTEKLVENCWSLILLLLIGLARIGGGLFISIHGPTLLTLANNVGVSVGDVSWIFSSRSVGLLLGGIATGVTMRKFNNMLTFGLSSFLLGAIVIATPWITTLWLLVIVVLVGGIGFGFQDAGMQALILQIWGEKESRGLISGYHFTIAVGAFLAPIIAQRLWSQQYIDLCPSSDFPATENNVSTSTTLTSRTTTPSFTDSTNPIVWAYLICGLFMFVVGLLFFLVGCCKIESRVRKLNVELVEQREESSPKNIMLLFALVCVYYFFCVAGETAYNSYIYSVSICSDLSFSTSDGTTINALFWAGFGAGRLGGMVLFRYLSPTKIILMDLIATIAFMIIITIFGENKADVTWAVTFFYAFFQATIYPGGVSWTAKNTNISGNYSFIFSIGKALGTMVLLPVGGILFELDPFSVLYLVLGCSILNAASFGAMMIEGKRIYRRNEILVEEKNKENENTLEISLSNYSVNKRIPLT